MSNGKPFIGPNPTSSMVGLTFCLVSVGVLMGCVCSIAIASQAAPTKDKVKVPAFNIDVTLTEKARTRLESGKETIVVLAALTGAPKRNASVTVNEAGLVDLARGQITLSRAGQAKFDSLFVPVSKLAQLSSQDYDVNVNVFSGRRSSQNNLLECDFLDGKISKIQPVVTLKCGLIGEYSAQTKNSADAPSQPVPAHGSFTYK